jgi:hypothetical protein
VKKVKTLIIALLIVIGAVSVEAQKVQVAANPNADLTRFKTYTWSKGQLTQNPLVQQTIMEAVDRAMTAKGLSKVEADGDMTVVAWAAHESDMHIAYPSWHPGLNSIATGIVVGTSSWPVTKGTLVVDLTETSTKNSLWRATATETLDHGPTGNMAKDAKSVEKKINKAVQKMFKKYPRP